MATTLWLMAVGFVRMPACLAANETKMVWTRRRWILWLAAVALGLTATDGRAQTKKAPDTDTSTLYQDEGTKLEKSNKIWSESDNCGKESFRKFPDYTAEAALKRDAYMRDCLRKHRLPPRNDLAQPLKPGP